MNNKAFFSPLRPNHWHMRLVLNQQRRKIVERYSKRLLRSGIARKDEAAFLVLLDKNKKGLIPKIYFKKKRICTYSPVYEKFELGVP